MPFDPSFDDYVSADTIKAYFDEDGEKENPGFHLLWGDGVKILASSTTLPRKQVKARGKMGWVDNAALGGQSLLEYYFIDVGQGDGVLIKTPDFRHILLDAGYPRKAQPTGKSGADFVDWKFAKDYGSTAIVLDAMISSHIDWDHYGGLNDLLDVAQTADLDCTKVTVEAFYHSGLAHWKAFGGEPAGFGPYDPKGSTSATKWFTRLLGDRSSCVGATSGTGAQLRGEWGNFVANVAAAKKADGSPTDIARLSQNTQWLPGFPQGGSLAIRVLGPIEGSLAGKPTLLRLHSSASQITNGTSVLLRVDFGRSRTLLTGDLNARAHRALMGHYSGNEREFAVDVAKSCHHGSEDVSYSFLNHVKAACTVISSGDDEGHDHPRPRIVAASGLSGYVTLKDDELITPLVYSTELARSVMVGVPQTLDVTAAGGALHLKADFPKIEVAYKYTPPGALHASSGKKKLSASRVMHKLLYGLVNVRTDGEKILAATMNEGDESFTVKHFKSRF
jgi:beta-lactamase superfamily II metal-dependent hydrolase